MLPTHGTAVLMPGVGLPLEVVERAVRAPAPGEALVRIDACGVCGSDVFLHDGGFGPEKLPVVPGHEAAGVVVSVGSDEDAAWVGRQVALYYIDALQHARWALAGHENIGPGVERMGVDVDGAFAQYVTRRLTTLVVVDPPLDPATVAVATDALGTPYHALHTVARVQPGETVAVIGVGGIGSGAVQIAAQFGATVIAVGRSEGKLRTASELGAAVTIQSSAGAAAIIAAAGGQIDVVVQCAGESVGLDRLAIEIAGFRGRVVYVGVSREAFQISSTELIWRELAVLGSRGFTRQDIADVLELVRSGSLRTDHLTATRRPLAEAAEALDDLRAGRVMRTVLDIPRRSDDKAPAHEPAASDRYREARA